MSAFAHGPIQQIPMTTSDVYAFRITGHMDDDAAEALADFMNDVFDHSKKVSMLFDLSGFTGSDWDSMLHADVIEARFRALKHVSRYAVVGAPEPAAKMIGLMAKIIPVDARAFDAREASQAWAFVGAQPSA